jgi:hypothetical protein
MSKKHEDNQDMQSTVILINCLLSASWQLKRATGKKWKVGHDEQNGKRNFGSRAARQSNKVAELQ